MGIRRVIGRSIKKKFDVKSWLGVNQVVDNASMLKKMTKQVFEKQQPDDKKFDNFEKARQYYGLSPDRIKQKLSRTLKIAVAYLIAAIVILLYSVYVFYQGYWIGGFSALILAALAGVMALREHLAYYQIHQKTLKINWKEWFAFLLRHRGGKS